MASTRDIQRRIKGVKSTGKITRAMEMISAVKMRKATDAVLGIRPYAESVITVLRQLADLQKFNQHPLLAERPIERELYVIIASNRGLCGSFNSQIAKKLRSIRVEDELRGAEYITIGKKADALVKRLLASTEGGDGTIVASFPDLVSTPSTEAMRPVARIMIEKFLDGSIDRVVMIYTDFVSVISQTVKVRALLPVAEKDVMKSSHEMSRREELGEGLPQTEYVVEPSLERVLDVMVFQLLTMELYHAVLESNASQEAARMMAMRNATDAGNEMVGNLTLAYNQLRQQKITAEIAELSAGKAALES